MVGSLPAKLAAAGICLLFPSPCRLCGRRLDHAGRLPVCVDCLAAVPSLESAGCRQCGQAAPGAEATADGRCLRCQAEPPAYSAALSAAAYRDQARELVHLLKYQGVAPVAEYWARRMAELANRLPSLPEVIVPVPLGRRRERERGFNQSGEIGRRLARRLGCRYQRRGLWRRRETAPQSGLSAEERRKNVDGAFAADRRRVAGKRVLLVDDVLTTGATARAAAAALAAAGAAQVMVLTAARADLNFNPQALEVRA